MKFISFELTMPNVASWNGKWSGADKKYFIIKKFTDKFYDKEIKKLFNDVQVRNFYYNFGDGWCANVQMVVTNSSDAAKKRKISAGFCGYNWMVDSILKNGKIIA